MTKGHILCLPSRKSEIMKYFDLHFFDERNHFLCDRSQARNYETCRSEFNVFSRSWSANIWVTEKLATDKQSHKSIESEHQTLFPKVNVRSLIGVTACALRRNSSFVATVWEPPSNALRNRWVQKFWSKWKLYSCIIIATQKHLNWVILEVILVLCHNMQWCR